MKRILVIGEHSYIGNFFRDYVAKCKCDVEVTLASGRDEKWKAIDFSQYDTILHVAAIVHKKEQSDMQQLYEEVNTKLPLEVAKRAKENGVRQFVFLSTMAVYGEQSSPITQNTKEIPVTMYGRSKLAAEQELEVLAGEQFTVIVLRPPMVYGGNCPGNYRRLAGMAHKLPFFPKVNNKRSMIYVENLCECIVQEIKKAGQAYRIICPQNAEWVNTTDLVKEIRRANGKGTIIVPIPQILVRLCAKKIGTVQKVFGDCYYQQIQSDNSYQVAEFRETIERTEKE